MLPLETFKTVVASTPLVSIDLIVRDPQGRILLGQRNNRPAQGYWFVPGGRILKDETLQDALQRLLQMELGITTQPDTCSFLGVYQHFYPDNFSEASFSTHYVVLAYQLHITSAQLALPDVQHSAFLWLDVDTLLEHSKVHLHTKWYFQHNKQADAAWSESK